jgi:hypothetical protein
MSAAADVVAENSMPERACKLAAELLKATSDLMASRKPPPWSSLSGARAPSSRADWTYGARVIAGSK